MSTDAIFTQEEINTFKSHTEMYDLTVLQLKPVVLNHIVYKNENFNIKTYNVNKTVEIVESMTSTTELLRYMQNKLNKYEATKHERTIKSKIQEQI